VGTLAAGRYLGNVPQRCETPFAIVSRVVHRCACRLPRHDHALPYFSMLLEGRYGETVGGECFDYRPFQVGFHPARVAHVDAVGPGGGHFLCVEVRPAALEAAGLCIDRGASLLPADESLAMLRLYRAFDQGALTPLHVESLVMELCSRRDDRAGRGAQRWLRQLLQIVHEEHAEPLTVAALAARVGIHPVHAARAFRRRFGQTLGEYVNKVRIRAACDYISRDAGTLAGAASHAGFADHAHFCRVFRAEVGCTPSAFRAAARGRRAQSCLRAYSM